MAKKISAEQSLVPAQYEKDLQKSIARLLDTNQHDFVTKKMKYFWFHPKNESPTSNRKYHWSKMWEGVKKGVPDIIIIMDGRTYFAEVKVRYNKRDEDQIKRAEQMVSVGCFDLGVLRDMKKAHQMLDFLEGKNEAYVPTF